MFKHDVFSKDDNENDLQFCRYNLIKLRPYIDNDGLTEDFFIGLWDKYETELLEKSVTTPSTVGRLFEKLGLKYQ